MGGKRKDLAKFPSGLKAIVANSSESSDDASMEESEPEEVLWIDDSDVCDSD